MNLEECAPHRYTAAASQYMRAIQIWEALEERSEKMADALGKLGCLHNYMGQYQDAEDCHHRYVNKERVQRYW